MSNRMFRGQDKKPFKIVTVEECISCGLKMKRLFQLNDYIFKEGSKCQKCGSKTLMNAIYKEELK
jgi:DNA-directed RNA polymerase subunit RPC12/RpoP